MNSSQGSIAPLSKSSLRFSEFPTIQSARAKWFAAKERIPQAAAWEDFRVGTNIVFGRFPCARQCIC